MSRPPVPAPGRRPGLFAGAVALILASQPATARAATVEWLIGQLGLAAGQSTEVLVGDPRVSCSCGVQINAGKVPGRGSAFLLPVVVDTITDPNIVPAGRGLDVGITESELVPGERYLVQARVRLTCANATTATIRRTPVSLTIVDSATGRTEAVLQGVAA